MKFGVVYVIIMLLMFGVYGVSIEYKLLFVLFFFLWILNINFVKKRKNSWFIFKIVLELGYLINMINM